jgi:hypothetical protein
MDMAAAFHILFLLLNLLLFTPEFPVPCLAPRTDGTFLPSYDVLEPKFLRDVHVDVCFGTEKKGIVLKTFNFMI